MWYIDSDHVGRASLAMFEPKKGSSSGDFYQKAYFNFTTRS